MGLALPFLAFFLTPILQFYIGIPLPFLSALYEDSVIIY